MVRYSAAAAAATVLNRSRWRSRDRIGVEIICLSGFACSDGTGWVWRSRIEPTALATWMCTAGESHFGRSRCTPLG
ncbi:MAG TPA: hypothetical protein VFO40_15780 [Chthoniobacterales bacterium]|nr:hypothetical protein [Chthoniobacterales bacterium]